ncbi:PfkB family carbohydrate kinase [Alteromonas sp. a30]|uniref:PfkB family carbohydrate kinase n=1 Tax=Alteromonas sp. a30 TaxID=2730917 RepID=UPI00227EE217|nr:PfkB family carbohydrate kinase [Alteromonas sp. a30]MCY7296725.1 carbohydrate kinase [Alteromonas sp. a30]
MKQKVAVLGEALFDLIEQDNGSFMPFIGGSPYNVARGFVRQGLESHYLSPISSDRFGKQIYQSIQEEGIFVPENNRSEKPTSLALVYRNQQGNPDYRLYRQSVADLDISAQKLLATLPQNLSLFHTGSLALVPHMLPVLLPVIQTLQQQRTPISLDVNVRLGVEPNHQAYTDAIMQCVALADIVKVSDEDLLLMGLKGDPLTLAKSMLTMMTNGIVVLTLGEKGAFLLTENICIEQHSYPPECFGDAVGAGDTFFSAMLSQLLRTQAFEIATASEEIFADALKFASLAATMNVEKTGCHPPSFEQVNERLAELSMP